jgi:probable F420-dependent oxidoreductase
MHFGIGFANTVPFASAAEAVTMVQGAERFGFESVWTVEHVVFPESYASQYPYAADGRMPMTAATPLPDPLIWLAWVGAVTSTIRLATGIVILPQRNPVILAKEVATLDAMSGGRVHLGIGIGWLQEEFAALGVPWGGRADRTDEYVAVLRALWKGDDVSFAGAHVSLSGVSVNPKPAQPTVPIIIGGHTDAAARRAGRLGDGFFPAKGSPPRLAELFAIVRETAEAHGRDPAAIELTASTAGVLGAEPLAAVEELRSLGVERVIVPAFAFRTQPVSALERFAELVIEPCRRRFG